MANVRGWGRGTWGQGAWNQPIPVEISGLAGTSALGTISLVTNNNLSVTGNVGTSALGDETVISKALVLATGNVGTFGEPRANVWGLVDTSQTPNYSVVDTSQTPNYKEVA